jgi:hypothetical protein
VSQTKLFAESTFIAEDVFNGSGLNLFIFTFGFLAFNKRLDAVKPIDLVIGLSIRLLFRKQLLC